MLFFFCRTFVSLELNKKEIPVYVKQLGFSIIGQQICGDWDAWSGKCSMALCHK